MFVVTDVTYHVGESVAGAFFYKDEALKFAKERAASREAFLVDCVCVEKWDRDKKEDVETFMVHS